MKRRNKHAMKKYIGSAVAVVGAAAVIGTGFVYSNLNETVNAMYAPLSHKSADRESLSTLISDKKAINIMLVGVNPSDSKADVALLAVSPEKGTATSVNVPTKVTEASYAAGGVNAVAEKINAKYGIPVDAYMSININKLPVSIDRVGGIEVNGTHMNGTAATEYVKDAPESVRQAREQAVLRGLLKKTISPATVVNKSFLDSLGSEMQTNFTMSDMTSFATGYHKAVNNIKTVETVDIASVVNSVLK